MKLTELLQNKTRNFIWLTLGLVLIAVGLYFHSAQSVLSFDRVPDYQETVNQESLPVRVRIERIGIDLPVTESKIKNGVWEISDTGASHLGVSGRPGKSNMVIYGHNRAHLFGPLFKIEGGDLVEIRDENDEVYIYMVEKILEVNPNQVEVIAPTEEEILTLYTCSGFLDSKRLIVVAKPI